MNLALSFTDNITLNDGRLWKWIDQLIKLFAEFLASDLRLKC